MARTTPSVARWVRSFNFEIPSPSAHAFCERPFAARGAVRKLALSIASAHHSSRALTSHLSGTPPPRAIRVAPPFLAMQFSISAPHKNSPTGATEREKRHSDSSGHLWCRAPTEPSHEVKEGCKLVVKNCDSNQREKLERRTLP